MQPPEQRIDIAMPQPPFVQAATEQALVNSRAFFDQQFRIGAWERNNGPAQTRYFMSRLVEALPAPTAAYLRDNALSILDWGCAFGDGLDVLKQAFPECSITRTS